MATETQPLTDTQQEQADTQAVFDAVAAGKPLDPDVARRVQERGAKLRAAMKPDNGSFGVQVIREMRGPLDEEQERELTLAQRDILHQGDARLVDPDTGTVYVLVPDDEYNRLRKQ